MSSLRNAVKRVAHKERSQPAARKKLGLLEKHKDYVERAKDFKKKRKFISNLKKKADNRNPDEFYFKMNKSKVRNGVHRDDADNSMDASMVKLLKTQDLGYLVHKKAVDLRKAEKLQDNLHLIGASKSKNHTIFVDSKEEVRDFDVATHFETAPELAGRSFNRPRVADLESQNSSSFKDLKALEKIQRAAATSSTQSYKDLEHRSNRAKKLGKVINRLQLQRNLMGKGTKEKIKKRDSDGIETGAVVYKWKRQRSK